MASFSSLSHVIVVLKLTRKVRTKKILTMLKLQQLVKQSLTISIDQQKISNPCNHVIVYWVISVLFLSNSGINLFFLNEWMDGQVYWKLFWITYNPSSRTCVQKWCGVGGNVGNFLPLLELSNHSDTNTLRLGLPRQIFTWHRSPWSSLTLSLHHLSLFIYICTDEALCVFMCA